MLPVAIQELPFQAKDSYQQNRRHHSSTKLNKKQASSPHQQSHVIEMREKESLGLAQLPVHWGYSLS